MKCPCCNEEVKLEDVPHMCKKEAKGSKSALSDGLCAECEHLKALCRELLEGAHKCTEEPHYIVQPFLGIVKRYSETIDKHKLI